MLLVPGLVQLMSMREFWFSYLEEDKKLKNSPERGREETGIGNGHLEKQRVEEAVADIDEGVLVDVGVSNPVGSNVVVQRDVIGLVLGHGH